MNSIKKKTFAAKNFSGKQNNAMKKYVKNTKSSFLVKFKKTYLRQGLKKGMEFMLLACDATAKLQLQLLK